MPRKPLTEEELVELKRKIQKAKSTQSEIQGKREYLLQELSEKYNCASVAEAEVKVKNLGKEIDTLNEQVNEALRQIGVRWHANT